MAFQEEWLFRAHLRGGDVEQAESAFARGLQALKASGEAPDSANHFRLVSTHVSEHLTMGRLAAAGRNAERLGALARQHGEAGAVATVLQQAWPPVAGRAEAEARRAALAGVAAGQPSPATLALVQLTRARLARDGGDLETASADYEAALRQSTENFQRCAPQFLPAGLEWVGVLQSLGRPAEASAALAQLQPCAEAMVPASPWRRRWQELSRR